MNFLVDMRTFFHILCNKERMNAVDTKNYIAAKIKEYRKLRGLTQKELGEKIGVKHNTISSYENGTNEPEQDLLFKIANALNISINDLFPETTSKGVQIPILGYVIAGVPIEAVEDILGYEEISVDLARTGNFFCLRIKGDSMEPTFAEGDIIVVRQQPDVESNEIAVVLVNGDEGTVKRIKKSDNGITLIGDNVSSFLPTFYSNEEIERLPVTIIGKVIELRRSF